MSELERLKAELAKIQAQIDALPKVQTVFEESRERLAVEADTKKFWAASKSYRRGHYDDHCDMRAMVKVVQELRDAKDRIAELEARDAVPDRVDPDKPLEAYHPDGRVVDVEFDCLDTDGDIQIKPHRDVKKAHGFEAVVFIPSGEHWMPEACEWRIRNKGVK